MNKLYGAKHIEGQRSSGYKSTVYAMAEIVDNSVDAKANHIKIILFEKEVYTGSKRRMQLDKIVIADNGTGMKEKIMNTCLTFSEGEGKNDRRIGAFGVGLPNSSISCGRRVEVFSKLNSSDWKYVFLDIDDQLSRAEPGYEPAIDKAPVFKNSEINFGDFSTLIVWSNLDRLDVARASTLQERAKKLLGRIYRYKLNEGLRISFTIYRDDKKKPTHEEEDIIPYDPLFTTDKENYLTSEVWKWAYQEDPRGKTPDLSHLKEFNSMYYYRKHTENCEKNKTNVPLFQKFDDFWDVPYEVKFNGKTYKWKMRASFAHSTISNPGVRSGGGTELGRKIGEKMNGSTHFRSANIFFVRAGREIDFGSYGLYTVTDEKNRFWSIEIHFDSDLDELMGISNTKQSVMFKYIKTSDLDPFDEISEIPLGMQREILWSKMSESIVRAIKGMRKNLNDYAREFKRLRDSYINNSQTDVDPIPTPEPAVIQLIPKDIPWTEDQINEVSKYLKEKYMSVEFDLIKNQVTKFATGLTRTIVIYAPNESGNLFELTEKRGKLITVINSNHIYYKNIIDPLKTNNRSKIFAISIEMLIASAALEMDRLKQENSEKYEQPLNNYLLQLSSRLNEFISDSHISINMDEYEKEFIDELEKEEQF